MSDSISDKAKQALDNVAGAGTSDKIAGKATDLVGQVQEKVGDATGNHDLKSDGLANQVKGTTQEAVGEGKGLVEHIVEDVKDVAEHAVEGVKKLFHKD